MWAQQRADKEAQKALTQWYGEIGKRIDLPVTIMEKKRIETDSQWGDIMLVKMLTVDGSELVWFTGSSTYNFEPGDVFVCRGTVREHTEFKGVKSTKLSRCKLRPMGPVARLETFEEQMVESVAPESPAPPIPRGQL